ncbi:protein TolR [Alkalilimnicola ehrlichii]|uniref:protein TolR n=1 Tax=Alkalilimnicola ehrlichii TaxID=351052 RepID=UPI000E2E9A5F|nr:protein TolR [Alkalilimnicola ehrlichii]
MSEINVVPYIDVMLVLLVIFMVTAPLLYQAVEIDLPQVNAEPLPQDDIEPLIVNVYANGEFTFSVGIANPEPITEEELATAVAAAIERQPETPVMVRGDTEVAYGRVIAVMSQLQRAGVPKVGLMTQPPAGGRNAHARGL